MKSTKKYLTLALSIVFCASFQVFAMEKESEGMTNTSGEWTGPIGDSSGETGASDPLEEAQIEKKRNQQWLTKQIDILKVMDQDLQETQELNTWKIPTITRIEIKKLQEQIQSTISIITDMLSGRTPSNMEKIRKTMKSIHSEYRLYRQ